MSHRSPEAEKQLPRPPLSDRLDQYASRFGNRTDCYAKLAVSSLPVAETFASTHCTYLRRDGQAELARVTDYIH